MKTNPFTKLNLFFVAILITILNYASFGQISKGTFRIGPSLAYNGSTQEIDGLDGKFKTSTTSLEATAGYFLIDNLELGLSAKLTSTKSEFDSDEQTSSGTVIGPELTYMVGLSDKVYLPLSVGVGFNSQTIDDGSDEITLSGWGYGAGTGLEYIIENRLGARLSLIYSFGSLQDDDSDLEIDSSLFQVGIGVNFYFNR